MIIKKRTLQRLPQTRNDFSEEAAFDGRFIANWNGIKYNPLPRYRAIEWRGARVVDKIAGSDFEPQCGPKGGGQDARR